MKLNSIIIEFQNWLKCFLLFKFEFVNVAFILITKRPLQLKFNRSYDYYIRAAHSKLLLK